MNGKSRERHHPQDLHPAHSRLSILHLAAFAAGLSLHAHLLCLCRRIHFAARHLVRRLAGLATDFALPSLGRLWL